MIRRALLAVVALMGLCSCSLINDDSDCTENVSLFRFHYDMNLKKACASATEVKSVTLLAFDAQTGVLAYADRLVRDRADGCPEMTVRTAPGEYDVLVWAGNYDDHYSLPAPVVGSSKLADFTCGLAAAPGTDLESLFHSLRRVTLGYATASDPEVHDMTLTKDTNTVRVVLQHLSGAPLSHDDFEFTITDNNALLDYDNARHLHPQAVTYAPAYLSSGAIDINSNPRPGDNTAMQADDLPSGPALSVAMAEFKVSRLFADTDPMITVTRKSDGQKVLSVSLRQYAMIIRGYEHRDMDPQEYLDRQDEYNLTFFLDKNRLWLSAVVIVNDWYVIHHTVNPE